MLTGAKIKQVFFVLAMLWAVHATAQSKNDMLVKSWRIEDLKQASPVSPDLQPTIDNWRNEMKSRYRLTYHADGTYETQMGDREITGTWKLSADGTEMLCNTDAGDSKVFKIQQLTATNFVFKVVEGPEEVTFYMVPAKGSALTYIIGGLVLLAVILIIITAFKRKGRAPKA